jgi:hypothetical protein
MIYVDDAVKENTMGRHVATEGRRQGRTDGMRPLEAKT